MPLPKNEILFGKAVRHSTNMDEATINVYDEQASAYLELVGDHADDPYLLQFIQQVPRAGLVLDLGCGPGISSVVMQQHGLNVDAIDASAEMVLQAKRNFNVNARQAEFRDVTSTQAYHGIWANFSLLHCSKDEFQETLPRMVTALKPRGVFHLGMKLGDGAKRDSIGRFYSYYSADELQESCERNGLEILNTAHGEGPGLTGEVEPWIVLLAKK